MKARRSFFLVQKRILDVYNTRGVRIKRWCSPLRQAAHAKLAKCSHASTQSANLSGAFKELTATLAPNTDNMKLGVYEIAASCCVLSSTPPYAPYPRRRPIPSAVAIVAGQTQECHYTSFEAWLRMSTSWASIACSQKQWQDCHAAATDVRVYYVWLVACQGCIDIYDLPHSHYQS